MRSFQRSSDAEQIWLRDVENFFPTSEVRLVRIGFAPTLGTESFRNLGLLRARFYRADWLLEIRIG